MSAQNTAASRLYVVKETVSGTLQAPTSGDEALALQPGAEFAPAVDTINNDEQRASIGATKPILGLERPTAGFNHYLRGSALEGVNPDFTLLLESLFGSVSNFYAPMVVSALNDKLNFTDDDGTVTATVAHGSYKTPQLLAAAVTTAMNAANGAKIATCSYNTVNGKFKIVSTGTVLTLLWKTGANGSDNTDTHIGTLLGFSDAANNSGTAATTGYTAGTASNGIERVTAGGSTISNVVLTAGAAGYPRGMPMLIKNAVYEIRPSDGNPSGQNVTMGMDLLNAPGAGLGVGQPIAYIPVNSGHPTLSLWLLVANGGAVEAEAGALINQMDLTVDVGNPLNMAFQAASKLFFLNPVIIDATCNKLDFTDGAGTAAVTLTNKAYRTPIELAVAIQDALNAASADDWVVTYNSRGAKAGKFTIASNGVTTSLLWNSGGNTAVSIGTKLGYSLLADDTGAHTYDSDVVQVLADTFTPSLDDADPLVAKDMEVLIGDSDSYVSACIQTMSISVGLEISDVKCISAISGVDQKVVKKRTCSIEGTITLEPYDVEFFDSFINNKTKKFLFNFGPKVGGNWVPGKCGMVYSPTATISAVKIGDADGTAIYSITIKPFVDNTGQPEIYLGLV
jgi:hypothetical protein